MLLGIDVGGTHTDAVVVDQTGVKAAAKVVTDHHNLLHSIRAALGQVLAGLDPSGIRRLNLSTTLSTNAIIEGKTEDVGVVVSAGPGIDPENQRIGRHYHVISGAIDHRGVLARDLDEEELRAAVDACRKYGVRVWAAVGKFSTRNPAHEAAMAGAVGRDADFITQGHRLSGVLNFPRRVATAYFNGAVWRSYNDFAWAVEESAAEFGLSADINVLKADGGTMPLGLSKDRPVESILSGPAASVMGIVALCDVTEDSIILDVGGTTTDVAVFADGAPVIERDGMTVGSYPTLVRALKVRSIGVGGDSSLHRVDGRVLVGPERKGPSLAACGWYPGTVSPDPALTDAMNHLGLSDFGDAEASRQGIRRLADAWNMDPDGLCSRAVETAVSRIGETARNLVREINEKPVYTIHEVLKGKRIEPRKVYVMGGPAQVLAERLEKDFGLPVIVPEHYAYANAVGAAVTRATLEVRLFADTHQGRLLVSSLNVDRRIDKTYDLEAAKAEALALVRDAVGTMDAEDAGEPEIVEAETFNVVEGPVTTGKIIRVRCQVRPGVTRAFGRLAGAPEGRA